jgi:hypothetical protein
METVNLRRMAIVKDPKLGTIIGEELGLNPVLYWWWSNSSSASPPKSLYYVANSTSKLTINRCPMKEVFCQITTFRKVSHLSNNTDTVKEYALLTEKR